MTFTRNHAKMVAEELYKLIRKEVVEASKEITKDDTEEFICLKDAARMLGISPGYLYKKKDKIGCYTKIHGHILFAKRQLRNTISAGID